MLNENLLNENIISLDINANNNVDAIKQIGQMLCDNNYINNSYTQSVIEREQIFPTGLNLINTGIAIPHASPNNNVFKNGIAIARLNKPVKFHSMENPDEEIDINMIFMLALSSSDEHLDILKKLFCAFQNQNLINNLKHSKTKIEFLNLLINNL